MPLLLQLFHNYVPTVERSVKILQRCVLCAMIVSTRVRFVLLRNMRLNAYIFDLFREFVGNLINALSC
jgi:hypothetical protein